MGSSLQVPNNKLSKYMYVHKSHCKPKWYIPKFFKYYLTQIVIGKMVI